MKYFLSHMKWRPERVKFKSIYLFKTDYKTPYRDRTNRQRKKLVEIPGLFHSRRILTRKDPTLKTKNEPECDPQEQQSLDLAKNRTRT